MVTQLTESSVAAPPAGSPIITRGIFLQCDVREIDEDKRYAEFVAATENGVETWGGTEYLRMSGADLKRYKRNPVILDSHNRSEAGFVIGSGDIGTEKRNMIVGITFARTDRATEIWDLVRDKFLRAVSVGFISRSVQVVAEGESAGTGKNRIEGPARIVKEWELYEISILAVGADADALKRGQDGTLELQMRELLGLMREMKTQESSIMSEKTKQETAPSSPAVEVQQPETAPPAEERALEILRRDILAITPRGLEAVADGCVLEGLTLEASRERLLAAHAKRHVPVGTSEPTPIESPDAQPADGVADPMKLTDRALADMICG